MKTRNLFILACIAVLGFATAAPAEARDRHHYHHYDRRSYNHSFYRPSRPYAYRSYYRPVYYSAPYYSDYCEPRYYSARRYYGCPRTSGGLTISFGGFRGYCR